MLCCICSTALIICKLKTNRKVGACKLQLFKKHNQNLEHPEKSHMKGRSYCAKKKREGEIILLQTHKHTIKYNVCDNEIDEQQLINKHMESPLCFCHFLRGSSLTSNDYFNTFHRLGNNAYLVSSRCNYIFIINIMLCQYFCLYGT